MKNAVRISASVSCADLCPAEAIEIFQQAFPRHPVSSLAPSLAADFLDSFARNGVFLVARDPHTSRLLGFAIGGETSSLDRCRIRFIRAHAWQIALAALRSARRLRLLLVQLRRPKRPARAAQAPYQIRFIAVAPHARGMHVGATLLEAFEAALPPVSAYDAWIRAGDQDAAGFYAASGFQCRDSVDDNMRMWKDVPRKAAQMRADDESKPSGLGRRTMSDVRSGSVAN